MKLSASREGLWLCWRVHRQHEFSDRHRAFLCCRLHLHHLPASHADGWSPGVRADPQERRGPGTSPPAPAQCQAHEADAHGCWAAGGPLPQPHHPCAGNGLSMLGLLGAVPHTLCRCSGSTFLKLGLGTMTARPGKARACSQQPLHFGSLHSEDEAFEPGRLEQRFPLQSTDLNGVNAQLASGKLRSLSVASFEVWLCAE